MEAQRDARLMTEGKARPLTVVLAVNKVRAHLGEEARCVEQGSDSLLILEVLFVARPQRLGASGEAFMQS